VSDALLKVEALTADRGARRILDHISFDVRDREILGVIGPNGAGKTTLFECVARVQPFTSGTITGAPIFYMPDAIRPWPDQTVEWTLRLTAKMWRTALQWRPELDLERLARQRISSLSKGETKRLNMAMAMLAAQPVIFLDEPFDGLDLRQTRNVMSLLRSSARTLVLSIHQLADAARVCDRVLLLNNGQVVAEGAPAALGDLEELFLART
jgi:ABC-2 type transport system ATP-binding protein